MTINPLLQTSDRLRSAVLFFREAHDSIKQVRKYSGDPYWTHTERVALILINAGVEDEDMIIGALGHDCVEDVYPVNPHYSLKRIYNTFGPVVAGHVHDLTDVYTKEAFPNYNRKERHEQERVRMALINDRSKVMKACDIRDNTESIAIQDPAYAKKYIPEKILAAQELSNSFSDIKLKNIFHFILDKSTIVGQSLTRR